LRAPTLIAATLLAAACVRDPAGTTWARGEAVAQLLAEQVRAVEPGTVLRLADLAPFRWDRLYLLPPGLPAAAVVDSLGPGWPALADAGPAGRESAPRLVFVAGGAVGAAAALPLDAVELDAALLGRGYAPADAGFRVQRRSGATPRLVR
jgi:hypothetical protein